MPDITTPECYDDELLAKTLRGDLAETELERVMRHLCECPTCQARYERQLQRDANQIVRPDISAFETDDALDEILERTKAANDWIVHQGSGVGRFKVIRKIGQGGMGEIYECFDSKLNRVVALKKIRPDRLSPNLLSRLKKEATLQAGLNHSHIVQIYEVGMLGGTPYLAMEYVGGGTLRDRLQERPLAPVEAARLVGKLAAAMHQAHEAGVLHRDLKPANILLTKPSGNSKIGGEPEPKIADFGLAKAMGETSDLSETSIVLGTPVYLSPEQAAGKADEVGPPSDIYSLGVILYESLTGHPPFNANSSGLLLEMIKALEPVSPRKLAPGLSRYLETICLKCLAKEPGRRYADAQALADDLSRFVEGRPIEARPAGRVETAWRWSLRNRRLAASLATILAMIVLFSGYAGWSANYQSYLRRQAETESFRANQSEALARTQRDEAYRYLVDELRNLQVIITKLDNPRVRLANEPDVLGIQTQIHATIEQLAQSVVTDDRLVQEKPEIVLATLNTQVMTSRIVGRKEEMKQAAERLLAILPDAKRLTATLACECVNSVNVLAHELVGDGDLDGAFKVWEQLWNWFRDDQQLLLRKDDRLVDAYQSTIEAYIAFLKKNRKQAKAAEIELELAGIVKP